MTYLDAIILGIIQGLTEFLPVSSSGHLVFFQEVLSVKQPGVIFEVILHLGTLLSIFVYFRSKLISLVRSVFDSSKQDNRVLILYIIVGTIPAVVIGFSFESMIDQAFSNPILTSVFLILTGIILLIPTLVKKKENNLELTNGRSFLIGIGQALAILPGISRSGSTISTGLLLGIKPSLAAEFSFLLAIPAVGGAALLKITELKNIQSELIGPYLSGFFVSFIFGLFAVYVVLATVRKGKFQYFAYYCFAIGLVGLYIFS